MTRKNGKVLKNANKKLRLEQLENPKASIFIINTETVSNADAWSIISKKNIQFLTVDESHRFKSFNGVRSKNLHKFCKDVKPTYRFILTGSPILQDARDLWSQFMILDETILGNNYYAFQNKYFYDKNAGMPSHKHFPLWLPRKDMNDNLNDIIYRHADRVMKDEVLDLPERMYEKIEVTMDSKQRKIYDSMKSDLVTFLDNPNTIQVEDILDVSNALPPMMSVDLAITKTIRLQQLICGIFTSDKGEVTSLDINRLKILKDMLLEVTANKANKVIIWSVFTPTYSQLINICEQLGVKYTLLTGLQSKKEKQENVDSFNNDPECRIIIANQAAGGTGVNLTAANYEFFYSRSFSLEHDLQADARAYRGGQKRKTIRYDLITPDTIDQRVLERLADKRNQAEDILATKSEFTKGEILSLI